MRFEPLSIEGAFLVHVDPIVDERGFFARTACEDEFGGRGLIGRFAQWSISFNLREGTVRGLHYSVGPSAETKLVRCIKGAVCDVIVDLRSGSRSFGHSTAVNLDHCGRDAVYIPVGVAHGFQTLQAGTELLYAIDKPFQSGAGRGLRWNDPIAGIVWPLPIAAISERDSTYPDFASSELS